MNKFLDFVLSSGGIIVCVLIVGVALTGLLTYTMISTERQCLAAGYPDYKYDVTLTQYCIKIVDQTSIVTPLSELKESQ